MKATDLMVGDYVRVIFSQKIVKVKEIKQSCIYTDDNGYEYNEIEPIPLTPEILEKNSYILNKEETYGPIQDVYTHFTEFYDFPLGKGFYIEHDTVADDYWITDHVFIHFKTVHEFQHALRLCGIEKIEL